MTIKQIEARLIISTDIDGQCSKVTYTTYTDPVTGKTLCFAEHARPTEIAFVPSILAPVRNNLSRTRIIAGIKSAHGQNISGDSARIFNIQQLPQSNPQQRKPNAHAKPLLIHWRILCLKRQRATPE